MTEEKKNLGGAPAFKPTSEERELVQTLAGFGIPQDDIALVVRDGIAPKTLRKHFKAELQVGAVKANSKVIGALFKAATGDGAGAVTAAIFWAKTRLGWKETAVQQIELMDEPSEGLDWVEKARIVGWTLRKGADALEEQGALIEHEGPVN